MTASDHLSDIQFRNPGEMGFIGSRDYAGKIGDIEFAPGGESDHRVKKIMESAKTEGIKEPVEVKGPAYGGERYLHDGHHRYVAAKRLGIDVPIKGWY